LCKYGAAVVHNPLFLVNGLFWVFFGNYFKCRQDFIADLINKSDSCNELSQFNRTLVLLYKVDMSAIIENGPTPEETEKFKEALAEYGSILGKIALPSLILSAVGMFAGKEIIGNLVEHVIPSIPDINLESAKCLGALLGLLVVHESSNRLGELAAEVEVRKMTDKIAAE
jgi:hypothetical protein